MENNSVLWALVGVVVGAVLTGIINYLLQLSQFRHNKEMFLLQNKGKEFVKEIILDKLNHRTHIERSFYAIKGGIGGFNDDEIRKFLHEVGATKSPRKDDSGEWWYLKEREMEYIAKKKTKNK